MGMDLLSYKRVLIVDDERDVLEALEEVLSMCDVVKAQSFDEAKELLETQYFDIAVLDIMGVDGYKLLDIANQREVLAVMLTAHALSPEDTVKSFNEGAALYVTKEKLYDMPTYLNDVLEAQSKGKKLWWRWLDRFGSYYNKRFGRSWKNVDPEFWKKFESWQ
jgi:DNA-binding NtrC family response regulator